MFIARWAMLFVLAVTVQPIVPALAKTGSATRVAKPPALGTDLDVLLGLVPPQAVRDILLGGCEVSYRAKLNKEPELEQALPGIQDRMLAAASRYCHANVDQATEEIRGHIRERWRTKFSANEIHRLAEFFAPTVAQNQGFRVDFDPGDTASAAYKRAAKSWHDPNIGKRARAIEATPGGTALLAKAAKELEQMRQDVQTDPSLVTFVRAMLKEGHLAANAYAAEKGHEPLYSD